jgi:hypothetical protein
MTNEPSIWDQVAKKTQEAFDRPNSGYAAPPPSDAELKKISQTTSWKK